MKTVNIEELKKRVNEVGGCDAKDAFAMGWDKAIETVLSIIGDISEDSTRCYKVGDQIEVDLDGFGVFTATVQKVYNDAVTFMFDECVATMPMNRTRTNAGGYEASGLCYWVNTTLKDAFPEELKERLIDISIPTYGQMFGHDETYHEYFEPDNDEQFELMKIRKNRISDFNNKPEWCWLQNATKEEVSATIFASVNPNSLMNYFSATNATNSFGVRPVFTTTYKTVHVSLCRASIGDEETWTKDDE